MNPRSPWARIPVLRARPRPVGALVAVAILAWVTATAAAPAAVHSRPWDRGARGSEGQSTSSLDGALPLTGRQLADAIDGIGVAIGEPGFYRAAIAAVEELAGDRHPFVGYLRIRWARRLLDAGKRGEGLEQALAGEDILREHLLMSLRSLSETEALRLARLRESALDMILGIAVTVTSTPDRARCWDAFIRSRAVVLDEMAARRRAIGSSGDTTLSRLAGALAEARQRIAETGFREPDADGGDRVRLHALRARRDSLEREIARRSRPFREQLARERAALSDVREALRPGEVLVAYAYYHPIPPGRIRPRSPTYGFLDRLEQRPGASVLAFVLRADGTGPTVVPLGQGAEIDALIGRWRWLVTAGVAAEPDSTLWRALRAAGHMLRQRIWDPVAARVGHAERIFVVFDGALQLLSLDALPLDDRSDTFLAERLGLVQYLSAERDLVGRGAAPSDGCALLAMGGMIFGPSGAGSVGAQGTRGPAVVPDGDCRPRRDTPFASLPASENEARDIARLWSEDAQGCPSDLILGADATEGRFKREAEAHSAIHLATHGFFFECPQDRTEGGDDPTSRRWLAPPAAGVASPLERSGLVFSEAAAPGASSSDDDGFLTAEEVGSLDLSRARLIVLSGCETGEGVLASREGLLGLRRAFAVAGAGGIVVSLWPVEDQSTRAIMQVLWDARLRRGRDLAAAMREASLEILGRLRRGSGPPAPGLWASFVVTGIESDR